MKCKELADEYGITAMRVGKLRRQGFPKGRGELSEKEVEYVRSELERQNPTNQDIRELAPVEVQVVITHEGNLSRYMECMERGKTGRFRLLMPFGIKKENFPKGKVTQAVKVNQDGKELYIHATLARKGWEYENLRG